MMGRRPVLLGLLAAVMTAPRGVRAAGGPAADPRSRLAELERRHGGTLGVAVLDTASGELVLHRADERFPLCSTFKFLAAARVLARVDRGEEQLGRRIVFSEADLVSYSPVTKEHVGGEGMTLEAICEAAITLSDNTAGNLLLDSFGGPAALTRYVRTLGDKKTRLDRRETELNEAKPGDPRDTTTPAAMLQDMQRLLVGDALSASSRERLVAWLTASKTGAKRLRAGVPPDWRAGDKTGTSGNGVVSDIAIFWPPDRAPLLVSAYYRGPEGTGDAVLEAVGRLVAELPAR
ncbi:beta-lactamase class A [Stigmatella aurantiaca]|uniref:Beta-lactamase n=2 Tax=Stigmatella aurantiaca TaxID=41 RepID=A0A1H8D7F7_STIAU|nr:beta-lactamase class A [Stigmatella aurantiaca]